MNEQLACSADRPLSARRGWIILFLSFLALYALTASRGVQWQDSGFHIWRIVSGEILSPRGLALTHPLHYYLGRIALSPSLLEPSLAITLISSIAAAIAVANTYGCSLILTRNKLVSLFAALTLGLAHTVWQLATITETYTLGIALLSGELWALLLFARTQQSRYALLLALLNGLGVANHMLAGLTTPVVLAVAIYGLKHHRLSVSQFLAGMALWLVGSAPYSMLVAAEWWSSGDLVATLSSALFGKEFAGAVLNATPSLQNSMVTAGFVALNFPNLMLPFAAIGLIMVWRHIDNRFFNRAVVAALFVHFLFAVRYNIVDQHTFFLPTYLLLCILSSVGLGSLIERATMQRRRILLWVSFTFLAMTPVVYALAPTIGKTLNILNDVEHRKPYRDDYQYLLTPWSVADSSAQQLSTKVLESADPGAVVLIEDEMVLPAIRYRLWRANRDDVGVVLIEDPDQSNLKWNNAHHYILVPMDRELPMIKPPTGRPWERSGDLYMLGQQNPQREAAADE